MVSKTHRELMARPSYYANLVGRQTQGLILPEVLPPAGMPCGGEGLAASAAA